MAKKSILMKPTTDSIKSTAVTGGAAVVGFQGARYLKNAAPDVNNPWVQGGIAVLGLALHAAVDGDSEASDALRGLGIGVAVHAAGELADYAGQMISTPSETGEAANGLGQISEHVKMMLCKDYQPMTGIHGVRGIRMVDAPPVYLAQPSYNPPQSLAQPDGEKVYPALA